MLRTRKGQIRALLDTGASNNFIAKELAMKLGLKIEKEERTILLGKGDCRSEGAVELVLGDAEGKYSYKIRAIVITDLNDGLIIGYPTMKELDVEIIPRQGRVRIFNGEEAILNQQRYDLKIVKECRRQEDCQESKFGKNEWLNKEIGKLLQKEVGPETNGFVNLEHEIELKEGAQPIYARPYRRNEKDNEIISSEITKMLENNIVRESVSPFASQVVLVKKTGRILTILCRLPKIK